MNKNTVSVIFDDQKLSITQIVSALTQAGYAVPHYEKEKD